jgi:hypothetical protein
MDGIPGASAAKVCRAPATSGPWKPTFGGPNFVVAPEQNTRNYESVWYAIAAPE